MPRRSPSSSSCSRFIPLWLVFLVLASLGIGATGSEPQTIDAEVWRNEQLMTISTKIHNAESESDRLEYVARQSWLRRWKPGRMPGAITISPIKSEQSEEPSLGNLNRPADIDLNAWQQMISMQRRLLEMDTDDKRKINLPAIINLASQLESALSEQLPMEAQQLPAPTAWVLAYTRYRLGRALAYRELPVVREKWPISKPDQYQKQLSAVYQRLTRQANQGRPEFILLEDRMLRRAGKKGRALELLEANRQSIEPKWYLKKRRDLLRELDWEPAYQEAARRYVEAGYSDES